MQDLAPRAKSDHAHPSLVRVDDVWQAELRLVFGKHGPKTTLDRSSHRGPLYVQRPFYPEGPRTCHVYLLHPPGGVSGRDELFIETTVGPGASALVTTPAAGKFYRRGSAAGATQRQHLRVGDGASLEWLPQESIVFDGAAVDFVTRVDLAADSAFVGWEVYCLGRPACGERFTNGRCANRYELSIGGGLAYLERAFYDDHGLALRAPWGLSGQCAFGTLLAYPADAALLGEVRAAIGRRLSPVVGGDVLVATLLGPSGNVLCCRYLGSSAATGREHFAACWAALRSRLVGAPAHSPRIWST